jgi:hypothetical protein
MRSENPFWVVVSEEFPTSITYKHQNEESAKKEAFRLAKMHGGKFIVMQAIYAAESNNIIETEYCDIPF